MTRDDINETLQSLMEVFYAAKEYISEPSAIHRAARLADLKKAVDEYEHKYWEKFGGRNDRT